MIDISEVVKVRLYYSDIPPMGVSVIPTSNPAGYWIEATLLRRDGSNGEPNNYHTAVLKGNPVIKRILQMPEDEFRKWYANASRTMLEMLERLRLIAEVPTTNYMTPHIGGSRFRPELHEPEGIRNLENRLEQLEVIRTLKTLSQDSAS